MQEAMIIKVEQKHSSPNLDLDKIMNLMQNLDKGKKSAHMMRSLIIQQQNPTTSNKRALNHHSMVCLDTFVTSLSILKSFDFDQVFARNRNQVHVDNDDEEEGDVKFYNDLWSFEEFDDDQGSPKMSTSKGRIRECYKKRKIGGGSREEEVTHLTDDDGFGQKLILNSHHPRKIGKELREEEATQLTDDGFAWRKYGQKLILNSHHPRQYYRCTQKYDQNCPATKQVQQVSDKPNKYKIIYIGNHTCNKYFSKTPPSFTINDVPRDHPSSSIWSFEQFNQVNPILFPTTSPFPTGGLAILQSQYSSPSVSPNNVSISQDMTATTYPLPTMSLSQNTPSSVSPNNHLISQDMTATTRPMTTRVSSSSAYPLPIMRIVSQNTPSVSPNNLSISQDMTRVSSASAYPLPTMMIVCQNTPSVSSNNLSNSHDMTATTSRITSSSYPASGLSNEFSSGAEIYSSTASSVMNVEEDEFSFMMDDYSDIVRDFSDLLPDWWTS